MIFSFRCLGYKEGDFPEAEKAAKEVLSLPIYPEMTVNEMAAVALGINEFFRQNHATHLYKE